MLDTVLSAAAYSGWALPLAETLVKTLAARNETLAAAESCTAGLAADFIARIPGASKVLWGSFVTYTADAKIKMLAVPEELIETYGAVSRPVALAMARGALEKSGASWAVSVTGLAGPEGDGSRTPVGTIWVGISGRADISDKTGGAGIFGSPGEAAPADIGKAGISVPADRAGGGNVSGGADVSDGAETAGREGETSNYPPAEAKMFLFKGSRNVVREAAAAVALEELLKRIGA